MKQSRRSAIRMGIPPNLHHPARNAAPIVPYPDLSSLEKAAVEDAIVEAWRRLPAAAIRRNLPLDTAPEEPLTRLLRDELDILRRDSSQPVPGFSEDAFQRIPESEAVPDAAGRLDPFISFYPDLVFRPVKTPRQVVHDVEYGLFVECKIVDQTKAHHSIRYYCKEGIRRFVAGEYAAAMPSAMMVAYVRGPSSIPSHLGPYLEKPASLSAYETTQKPSPVARRGQPKGHELFSSRHRRAQVRVWSLHPPGDIELTHLWLRLPK